MNATMPESEIERPEQDFSAPDESQRVENADLAEDMARASTPYRSEAAKLRKDKAVMEAIGASPGTIELTENEAQRADETAEWKEFLEPIEQDAWNRARDMSVADLRRARHVMKDKRQELMGRSRMMDSVGATNEEAKADQKTLLNREIAVHDTIDRVYRKQLESLGEQPEI